MNATTPLAIAAPAAARLTFVCVCVAIFGVASSVTAAAARRGHEERHVKT